LISTAREPSRPSYRRVVAFGALWAAIAGAALFAPGCYGRNCEGGFETFGADAGQKGQMLDENKWQSGPQDGTWLWFPRQRYYIFNIPELGGRTPSIVIPYISASPQPAKTKDGNMTIGSGNVAELFQVAPNRVDVKNDTCSDYYLRLVVEAPAFSPEQTPIPDGGTEAGSERDAGIDDAAPTDASDAEAGN
jgi:hypothetical protein